MSLHFQQLTSGLFCVSGPVTAARRCCIMTTSVIRVWVKLMCRPGCPAVKDWWAPACRSNQPPLKSDWSVRNKKQISPHHQHTKIFIISPKVSLQMSCYCLQFTSYSLMWSEFKIITISLKWTLNTCLSEGTFSHLAKTKCHLMTLYKCVCCEVRVRSNLMLPEDTSTQSHSWGSNPQPFFLLPPEPQSSPIL